MPIIVPENFPALKTLSEQDLFLMEYDKAIGQDIRPLKILILNLMPIKIATETQLLRLLSNTLIQVEVTFLHPETHESKNTDANHMKTFYKTFSEVKDQKFDGMIITGAPVENIEFEDVNYWNELKSIMDYSETNITSTLYICWGAQAGLYHFYNIPKYKLENKMFGIFQHKLLNKHCPLLRGYDDIFNAPHSRHTETRREDVEKIDDLEILAESEEAGVYIVANKSRSKVFVTGHSEYDNLTLHFEYTRDKEAGLKPQLPKNYYPGDNSQNKPPNTWRGHSNLLFSNWLNYCVYQITNYDLNKK